MRGIRGLLQELRLPGVTVPAGCMASIKQVVTASARSAWSHARCPGTEVQWSYDWTGARPDFAQTCNRSRPRVNLPSANVAAADVFNALVALEATEAAILTSAASKAVPTRDNRTVSTAVRTVAGDEAEEREAGLPRIALVRESPNYLAAVQAALRSSWRFVPLSPHVPASTLSQVEVSFGTAKTSCCPFSCAHRL